jgi:septum formation protein
MSRLVLGSGSPRRRSLLALAGFDIDAVIPPNIPEVRGATEAPIAYVRRLSRQKAAAVQVDGAWVLAADTIVHRGDAIFEKPTDAANASEMLRGLSGDWHKVTTAWCLRWSGPGRSQSGRRLLHGQRTSKVCFRSLTDLEIDRYIATGEGNDKAGGYAVQGEGAALIERVVGSTTNVVGLPLDSVVPALLAVGIARGAV